MLINKERLEQFIGNPLEYGLSRSEQMEMARELLSSMEQEPVVWPNHCDSTIPSALRFLAEKPRPIYGNSPYNTEHLYQLASEMEAMTRRPLYVAPQFTNSDSESTSLSNTGYPQPPVPFGFTDGDAHGMVYEPRHADRLANPIPVYRLPPQPAVVITNEEIDHIVIPISPDGLDEEKYPIEWHLQHDRERIRKALHEYACRAALEQGAKPPAYEIKRFGDFSVRSLYLECGEMTTSIQWFHFERGTVPEHVASRGFCEKHALQAIINTLQMKCDGMDDAPIQKIWPAQQEVK